MKLFVGAVLLVTAHAALLGSDKCTWGPSYWCSSLQAATSCKAFTHCVKNVWKHQRFDVEQTDVCLLSQKVVQTMRHVLPLRNGNAQATRMISYLCKRIEDNTIRRECKTLVSSFLPQIYELIQSGVKPASVASVLGFCTPKGDKAFPQDSSNCGNCRRFFEDMRPLLGDISKGKVATLFKLNVCQRMTGLKSECEAITDKITPAVMDWLAKPDSPELICAGLTRCPKGTHMEKFNLINILQVTKDISQVDGLECEACKLVVEEVRSLDRNPAIQNAVVDFLNDICSKLGSLTGQCKGFIKQNAAELFELIATELDPNVVCEFLLHCTRPELQGEWDKASSQTAPEAALVTISQHEEPEDKSAVDSPQGAQTANLGRSLECTVCGLAMEAVDRLITSKASEAEISVALQDVCKILPDSVRTTCDWFIATYTSVLVDWLTHGLDPTFVCDKIHICSDVMNDNILNVPEKSIITKDVQKMELASLECWTCELVVSRVERMIGENRTEAAIQHVLDDICNRLPPSIAPQCLSFVDENAPVVVKMLVQELDPNKVCIVLGLCKAGTGTTEVLEKLRKEKEGSSSECWMCELVVGSVEQLIGQNRTEEAVQLALDGICYTLPSGITPQCLSFVNEYAPMVVKMLLQQMTPHKVCVALGLCQAEQVPVAVQKTIDSQQESESPFLCALCKFVVAEVEKNTSDAVIIKAVQMVCDIVEGDLRQQCKDEVQNYGPAVLDLLRHMENPSEVCAMIKLCSNASKSSENKMQIAISKGNVRSSCQRLLNYIDKKDKSRLPQDTEKFLKTTCSRIWPKTVLKFYPKDKKQKQKKLVGRNPCTYGPAFWCASMENAKRCGIVEHCVKKYGLKP